MEIVNEPIEVIAIFEAKTGKIMPFKFKYRNKGIKINKLSNIYEEKLAGNKRIVFVYEHNENDFYEIKYEVDTLKWFLFKK